MKPRRIILTAALALVALAALAPMASASGGSSCYYSARGCVSVSGYYKPSTRTYVQPYVRSYPGYKLPSYSPSTYRLPSYKMPSSYGSYGSSSYSSYGSF
jgi:hypothetical protein